MPLGSSLRSFKPTALSPKAKSRYRRATGHRRPAAHLTMFTPAHHLTPPHTSSHHLAPPHAAHTTSRISRTPHTPFHSSPRHLGLRPRAAPDDCHAAGLGAGVPARQPGHPPRHEAAEHSHRHHRDGQAVRLWLCPCHVNQHPCAYLHQGHPVCVVCGSGRGGGRACVRACVVLCDLL